MNYIPKAIDFVVKNDLCIGCGLCTFECQDKALEMRWNDFGFLVPFQKGDCIGNGDCIRVCPFNPYPEDEVKTENELAGIFLKDTSNSDSKVGRYNGVYVGFSKDFRLTSSSGGIATFVFSNLLDRNIVNHIFSIKESNKPGIHYEYSISSTKQDLLAASETKYFPVTLSTIFDNIDKLDGKIAIVGVACFIKAIRLAQYTHPLLKEKIPFLVGIICGGVKSRFFTEYLSDKTGVPKDLYFKPKFRIKDLNSTALDYSFGCSSLTDNRERTLKMQTIGEMWGTGFFKSNACDFCDDVTTELADISLGDAWIDPYVNDGKGNNVVVTRSVLAEKIIRDGIESSNLEVEKLSLERLVSSQQGSFNHRQTGIPYRIKRFTKMGHHVPPKRFTKTSWKTLDLKILQYFRMKTRSNSLSIWKKEENSILFDKKIKKTLRLLRIATSISHFKRSFFARFNIKLNI